MIRFPRLALLLGLIAIPALGQQQPATTPQPPVAAQPAAPVTDTPAKQSDKAAAYYHYSMAHIYEEMVTAYGRTELANKAIDVGWQRRTPPASGRQGVPPQHSEENVH